MTVHTLPLSIIRADAENRCAWPLSNGRREPCLRPDGKRPSQGACPPSHRDTPDTSEKGARAPMSLACSHPKQKKRCHLTSLVSEESPSERKKRPLRAERPVLPRPGAAVLSARRGLTAEFGMGSGDPPLCGSARGRRSRGQLYVARPGPGCAPPAPWRPHARAMPSRSRDVRLSECK